MKDIKILIMGKNKHYIDAIISSVAKLTNNINFADNSENAFIELSNLSYDFFITDLSPFNKEYTISCFTDAFSQTDLIIVSSTPSYIEESYALRGVAKEYIDIKNGIETLNKILADLHKNKKDKEKLKENLLNTYMMSSYNDSYNKMLLQCEKVAKSKANVLLIG